MKIIEFFRFIKAVKRAREVSLIFVKHGFYQVITNLGLSKVFIFKRYLKSAYPNDDFQNVPPEIRLRYALEELGPTFIKMGQIFSQEITSFPSKYIVELKKLQDNAGLNLVKFDEVREIVEKECGRNINDIFEKFEESPIASASIAQVHKATLKDGTPVAVKIKKPNAERIIKSDLSVLHFIINIIKNPVKELLYIENIEEILNEFGKNLTKELNFLTEAGYTEKIRIINSDKNSVLIPKIFWNYSTNNIIVEEFVDGIKVSDTDKIREKGYDGKHILKIFLNHFFKQIFISGYFNADPHPGNIFVVNQEMIAIIDFGSVGILTKDMRKLSLEYFMSFLKGNYDEASSKFISICVGDLTEKEEQAFKYEYTEFVEGFFNKPFKEIYSSEILIQTLNIGQRHGLSVPSELSMLFKALFSIESIARTLDPGFSFAKAGLNFFDFNELIDKKQKIKDIKDSFADKVKSYVGLFGGFPKKADKILKKMSEDNFSIDFIHKGLDGLIDEMERSSKRLVIGLLIVALIISSTLLIFLGNKTSMPWLETAGAVGWILGFLYILIVLFKGLK